MKLKTNTIKLAISSCLTISSAVSADIINYSFTGKFTFMDAAGIVQLNNSGSSGSDYGFRTDFTGTGAIDTFAGTGSAEIDGGGFSLFGRRLDISPITLQAIGDGAGSLGTLVAGEMDFSWGGTDGIPVNAIFDASGFFSNLFPATPGTTINADCFTCVTSRTSDYTINSPFGTLVGVLGTGPMVMTDFNTNGTTLGDLFPLVDDGIAGSPMTTSPFPGFNAGFDFTTITINQYVSPVPVPATIWLFSSGLIGLTGLTRYRRK